MKISAVLALCVATLASAQEPTAQAIQARELGLFNETINQSLGRTLGVASAYNALPNASMATLTNTSGARGLMKAANASLQNTYAPSPAYKEAFAAPIVNVTPNATSGTEEGPAVPKAVNKTLGEEVEEAKEVLKEAQEPRNTSDDKLLKAKDVSPKDGPETSTSLDGDDSDIDASLRERIAEDSKTVGRVAENLVSVQGDINHVEKEVLGKVFDMSSMKSFLNAHENAIKEHEKLDQEQEDLNNQTNLLTKQLDKAINETAEQDRKHHENMVQLSSQVSEDKAVIQGLQRELVPLVEMQKEVEKLPPINSNQSAENTKMTAAAQAATEELVYEKQKLTTYKETTGNLMKELVKQHNYATKCHQRLYQLNDQIHELNSRDAKMKYENGRESIKGEQIAKYLEEKNKALEDRLKKAKTNVETINFAKNNIKAKIGALQTEGQIQLEKLKKELGDLKVQSAQVEQAMMAKVTNRKVIEKALKADMLNVEDMQARILAGRLDKLRRNNTQMTTDLNNLRSGLQEAQVNTAKAEAERVSVLAMAAKMKEEAANKTQEAQEVAQEALAKVVAIKQKADEFAQQAQDATMEAQASMLTECSVIWDKQHQNVLQKLDKCETTKLDLASTQASVATLTSSVKSADATR